MNDFDEHQPKEPFPFCVKATAIIVGIPLLNVLIPGSVIWMLTLIGCTPPEEFQRETPESPPTQSVIDADMAQFRREVRELSPEEAMRRSRERNP